MIVGDLVSTNDGRTGRIRKFVRQTRGLKKLLAWVEVAPGEQHCYEAQTLRHQPTSEDLTDAMVDSHGIGQEDAIRDVVAWLDWCIEHQANTCCRDWERAKLEAVRDIRADLASGAWRRDGVTR